MNHPANISKITLGTVQLGTSYGVANKIGQPTLANSHEILQFALHNGISALDTARIYGNAEEVIGSFEHANEFFIISKFKLSNAALSNLDVAISEAKESVGVSLKFLQIDCIPLFLFHKNINQEMEQVVAIVPRVLEALMKEGLINEGGISVYSPADLQFIIDWSHINAVQVPMNILDTRLLQGQLLDTLISNHVKVFIRSIFLQGLLLMDEVDLPPRLGNSKKYLQQIKSMAATANKTISDLAFSFVRDTPGVTSIVIGVDTIEQLKENIRLLSSERLSEKDYTELLELSKNIPEVIITPALWNI